MAAHSPRWLPLPSIHHGIATSNFRPTPSALGTASSAATATPTATPRSPSTPGRSNRYSWSRDSGASVRSGAGSVAGSGAGHEDGAEQGNVYEQEVMLGDEVYAFEHARAEDGAEWYRGYVLPYQDIQASAQHAAADSDTAPEPLVYLGIFPAACVHITAHTPDSQGVLREAFERMAGESGGRAGTAAQAGQGIGQGKREPAMEPVLEEEDESAPEREADEGGAEAKTANGSDRPERSSMPPPPFTPGPKLQPPLPTVGARNPDATGPASDHLISEIAYTVRDWNARLPSYLVQRRYKLFDTVARYIRALLVARQQLVAGLLTRYEEDELRREIVWTMNRGAVGQGLDVVVRDLKTGRVGTVEREAEAGTVWMSGIELYALQVLTAQAEHPLSRIKLDSVVDLEGQRSIGKLKRKAASHGPLTATRDTSTRIVLEIKTLIARLPQGDTVEVFCSVYQGSSGAYLTEEFRVELDHGVPVGLPVGTRMRTVFRGLRELDSTCFLIVRLVRKGMRGASALGRSDTITRETTPAMRSPSRQDGLPNGGSRVDKAPQTPQLDSHEWITVTPPENRVRTPLGYAALALDRLRAGEGGAQDFHLEVFAPREEGMWASVPAELLSNQRGSLLASTTVDAVVITAEMETNSNGPVPRHIHLSSPLDPFDVTVAPRNDLYLKIWQCSLDGPIGRQLPITQRSALEIRLEVRNTASGQRLPFLQLGGSSVAAHSTETRSIVLPHARKPLIAELNRVVIPNEECHALLTVYEVQQEASMSAKPLGIAYLPLNSAPIAVHADGAFNLVLHPYTAASVEAMRYLQLPAVATSDSSGDTVTLRIQNISARTSNSVVLGLTQRRDRPETSEGSVTELLHLITFVPPLEIIKYLAELLDAIFAILSSNIPDHEAESVQDHIRRALIAILDAVQDRRFAFEGDPIASYLANFRWSATGIPLIKAIRRVVRDSSSTEYRQTAKHLAGLVNFVLASRRPLRSINGSTLGEHLELQLDSEIRGLIADDLPAIFERTDAKTLGSRILVVQQLGPLAEALMTLYSRDEIGDMLVKFADLASIDMTPGKASQAKLTFLIKDVILGVHFQDLELRSMLLPNLCRVLRAHLVWTSLADAHTSGVSLSTRLGTTRQAIAAVAAIVHSLSRSLVESQSEQDRIQDEDNLEYVLSALLPHLISSFRIASAYPVPTGHALPKTQEMAIFPCDIHLVDISQAPRDGFDQDASHPLTRECAAIILALLIACPRERILSYLVEFKEVHTESETVQLVLSALLFGQDALQGTKDTRQWWTYRAVARRALLSLLNAIRMAFLDRSSWEETDHQGEIWIASLNTTLRLLQDELSSVEQPLPHQTQTATWREWSKSGDETALLLADLRTCKPQNLQPGQIASASEAVLSACTLGSETAPALVTTLDSLLALGHEQDGDLGATQRTLLHMLDNSLALRNSRKSLTKFIFLEQLRAIHQDDASSNPFSERLDSMLGIVEGYMGLILRITDPHLAPHEYGVLALEAMSYVQGVQLRELEAKWAARLHQHLVAEGFKSTAGLALAREASCLDWGSNRSRKEQLLVQALSELDVGQNWELGIEVCGVLIDYHKRQTFDSSRLSALLFSEAQMHAKIAKAKPRPVNYFRTTLHNIGTETGTLTDYIWVAPAGKVEEQLRSACSRLTAKYGQVDIYTELDCIATERDDNNAPCICITAYAPVPDMAKDCIRLARHPNPYFLVNDVRKFRRLQMREQAGAIEVVEVTTADTLPNILPMSPVTQQKTSPITALQLALEEIKDAESALVAIEAYLRGGAHSDEPSSLLVLAENALDVPFSTGIARYREASAHALDEPSQNEEFETAMLNYARRLADLLSRFRETANEHARSYSDSLLKLFAKNFGEQIARDPALSAQVVKARQHVDPGSKPQPPLPGSDPDDTVLPISAPGSPLSRRINGSTNDSVRGFDESPVKTPQKRGPHSDFAPTDLSTATSSPSGSTSNHMGGEEQSLSRPDSRLSVGSKTSARSRMSGRFGSLLGRKSSERGRER